MASKATSEKLEPEIKKQPSIFDLISGGNLFDKGKRQILNRRYSERKSSSFVDPVKCGDAAASDGSIVIKSRPKPNEPKAAVSNCKALTVPCAIITQPISNSIAVNATRSFIHSINQAIEHIKTESVTPEADQADSPQPIVSTSTSEKNGPPVLSKAHTDQRPQSATQRHPPVLQRSITNPQPMSPFRRSSLQFKTANSSLLNTSASNFKFRKIVKTPANLPSVDYKKIYLHNASRRRKQTATNKSLSLTQRKQTSSSASAGHWQCAECDKSFASKFGLARHRLTQHKIPIPPKVPKPTVCDLCDKSFVKHASLKRHINKVHSESEGQPEESHIDTPESVVANNKNTQLQAPDSSWKPKAVKYTPKHARTQLAYNQMGNATDQPKKCKSRSWVLRLETGQPEIGTEFNAAQHVQGCQPATWLQVQCEQLSRQIVIQVENGDTYQHAQNQLQAQLCARAVARGYNALDVYTHFPQERRRYRAADKQRRILTRLIQNGKRKRRSIPIIGEQPAHAAALTSTNSEPDQEPISDQNSTAFNQSMYDDDNDVMMLTPKPTPNVHTSPSKAIYHGTREHGRYDVMPGMSQYGHKGQTLFYIASRDNPNKYYKLIMKKARPGLLIGYFVCNNCLVAMRKRGQKCTSVSWVLYLKDGQPHESGEFTDKQHVEGCEPSSWLQVQIEQLNRQVVMHVREGHSYEHAQYELMTDLCERAAAHGYSEQDVQNAMPKEVDNRNRNVAKMKQRKIWGQQCLNTNRKSKTVIID